MLIGARILRHPIALKRPAAPWSGARHGPKIESRE
ncbi:hypothetical protein Sinac_0941 [Singulisphaera acidiphila DSM 18658]|uniref:Uncharacterized protein n=1 Tax=Singulisphaera acidiphila (strain ATCC BAA-1392 / DSM 18658 / VKM B-2454 / MOB10) TaxID=886293 RepID=L0D7G7_SINAD|nr:hypothetical protein Sinac_0941 [Singulisphaera acidiphila DSM 18658]